MLCLLPWIVRENSVSLPLIANGGPLHRFKPGIYIFSRDRKKRIEVTKNRIDAIATIIFSDISAIIYRK